MKTFRRLLRDRSALIGFILIAGLVLAAIFMVVVVAEIIITQVRKRIL